jgi:hypothetical protein
VRFGVPVDQHDLRGAVAELQRDNA